MNKYKQLTKRLSKEAAIGAAVLGGAAAVMLGAGSYAVSAAASQQKAESALAQQRAQLGTMKTQLENSGAAEKHFAEIQLNRENGDFSTNLEGLRDWVREAKAQRRFTDSFKLNLAPIALSNKPELVGLDYDVALREPVRIDLEAMSDLHVLAFIDGLQHAAPGMARLTFLEMSREGDLNAAAYNQMVSGAAPKTVTARLQFSWVGVHPKGSVVTAAANAAANPAAANPAAPGLPGGVQ